MSNKFNRAVDSLIWDLIEQHRQVFPDQYRDVPDEPVPDDPETQPVPDDEPRRVKIVVRGLRASHFELYESSEMTESADLRH